MITAGRCFPKMEREWSKTRVNCLYYILGGTCNLLEIFRTILKFLEYSLSILGKP
jgi:hypothetical protein